MYFEAEAPFINYLDNVAEVVRRGDVPAGHLALPVERQDEEGGGGDRGGHVEQRPLPDSAVHQLQEGRVAVFGGVADGQVPLSRHHHRQEGRGVEQHWLNEEYSNG